MSLHLPKYVQDPMNTDTSSSSGDSTLIRDSYQHPQPIFKLRALLDYSDSGQISLGIEYASNLLNSPKPKTKTKTYRDLEPINQETDERIINTFVQDLRQTLSQYLILGDWQDEDNEEDEGNEDPRELLDIWDNLVRSKAEELSQQVEGEYSELSGRFKIEKALFNVTISRPSAALGKRFEEVDSEEESDSESSMEVLEWDSEEGY